MKTKMLRFILPAFLTVAVQSQGQQPAQTPAKPVITQTLTYVKVTTGMGNDFVQLLRESTMKVAQMRADAGEIISWTILRAVMPAGEEARADYLISTLFDGQAKEPMSTADFDAALKKSGSSVAPADFYARRRSLARLVASELWQIDERVGAPKKGHYIVLNSMKVHDYEAYSRFESEVWKPLAAAWVKDGSMSGWIYATKRLPGGTETPYTGYSADMFPTWDALFADRGMEATFAKVHPGVSLEETWEKMPKLRSLAKRELWIVEERIEKKKM